MDHIVLIETYWNVKADAGDGFMNIPGINRNILECKVVRISDVSFTLIWY